MTPDQASKLETAEGRALGRKGRDVQVDTASTGRRFLGLDAPGGLWAQLGGVNKGGVAQGPARMSSSATSTAATGPRIRPSRTGRSTARTGTCIRTRSQASTGICQAGEDFPASTCNNKVIAARYYNAGIGPQHARLRSSCPRVTTTATDRTPRRRRPATTASRRRATRPASARSAAWRRGPASPSTRPAGSTETRRTAAAPPPTSSAAIDQAVADGVDVINYSISGTHDRLPRPGRGRVPVRRRRRGVRRRRRPATAARRVDRRPSEPVDHDGRPPARTTATVSGTVTLGNGATYTGRSASPRRRDRPARSTRGGGQAGADRDGMRSATRAADGGTPSTRPRSRARSSSATAASNAAYDKSLAVKDAGGVGMVLVNPSPNSVNADFHFVPTVHLEDTVAPRSRPTPQRPARRRRSPQATLVYNAPAPFTASFSSRGPAPAPAVATS